MRKAAFAVLAFLLITGCAKHRDSNPRQAPGFGLKDLSGNTVSLAQFRGHPVMLDFWATWCGPCLMASPYVEAFYERHKKDGLVVLGMNMDDDPSVVYAFAKRMKVPYPVLFAGDSSVAADYRLDGFPTFFFIDAQGNADQAFEGFSPYMPDAWESELQHLLAQSH